MQRAKEALDAGLAAGSKELSPPPAAAPRGLPADSRAVLAKPEPSRLRPGQLMEFRRCEGVEVKLWGRQVRVSVGEWQEGSDVLVTARTKPDSALLATARDAANVRSFTLLEGLRDGTGLLFTLGKRPLALPGEASSRRRSFTFSPLRPPQALTLTLTLTITITLTLALTLTLTLTLTSSIW